MSRVFNMVGGGSGSTGAQKKATIVVSYPSGATCTVYNSSGKSYTALDTSGSAAFVVDAGTWTVKATNGTHTDTESVTVAAGGWAEVGLSFEMVLFAAGQGALVPFSIAKQQNSSTSVTANAISFTVNKLGYSHSVVFTTNAINVTNYSKLKVTYTGSGDDASYFGLLSGGPYVNSAGQFANLNWVAGGFSSSIDISNVTGLRYVGLKGQSNLTVTEVKLT